MSEINGSTLTARLLLNPDSGRAKAEGITAEWMSSELLRRGIHTQDLRVGYIDGVTSAVGSLEPGSLLIIAGGDGTIYEAIQNPAILQVRIGIIPLGTANNLARAAGIPMDIDAAIDNIVLGDEYPIDLGLAINRVFTQAAGAGLHAEAFHIYGKRRGKSFIGAVRAFLDALKVWEPQPMCISVDGQTVCEEAMQVTAANTPVYGRHIHIAPDARIDDGLLDIVIARSMTRRELIYSIVELVEGRSMDPSKVTRVRGKRIDITSPSGAKIPVHADAEPIGFAPVTIEVLPSCLRLITRR